MSPNRTSFKEQKVISIYRSHLFPFDGLHNCIIVYVFTGKTPWITLNGTDVPDSTLAIEHLSKHFNIDMNSHLSPSEKAIAKGMRHMMEDHCYWAFLRDRFDFSKGLQMTVR